MLFHLTAIFALGPFSAATLIQRDDGFDNTQLFAAKSMVVFTIISSISDE